MLEVAPRRRSVAPKLCGERQGATHGLGSSRLQRLDVTGHSFSKAMLTLIYIYAMSVGQDRLRNFALLSRERATLKQINFEQMIYNFTAIKINKSGLAVTFLFGARVCKCVLFMASTFVCVYKIVLIMRIKLPPFTPSSSVLSFYICRTCMHFS